MKYFVAVVAFVCVFAVSQATTDSRLTLREGCDVTGIVDSVLKAANITADFCEVIITSNVERSADVLKCVSDSGKDWVSLINCVAGVAVNWVNDLTPASEAYVTSITQYAVQITEDIANCF